MHVQRYRFNEISLTRGMSNQVNGDPRKTVSAAAKTISLAMIGDWRMVAPKMK